MARFSHEWNHFFQGDHISATKLVATMTGWWFQLTPLKNDGVSSSLGMIFHSQYMGKNKKIQTTNQISIIHHYPPLTIIHHH